MIQPMEAEVLMQFTADNTLILTYKQQTIRLTPRQAQVLHDAIEIKFRGMPR